MRSIEVLDVEYDDYLVLFSCNEESDEFNFDGISRSTLERQAYEKEEKERWYTDKNIKFKASEVLERQQDNTEFVELVNRLKHTSIHEMGADDIKEEVRQLDKVSEGEMMEFFYGSIGDVDYWHRIREHLHYPFERVDLDFGFDPMEEDEYPPF